MNIAKTMNLESIVSINGINQIVYSGHFDGDTFEDFVIVPFDVKSKEVQYEQAQLIHGSDSLQVKGGLNYNMYPIAAKNTSVLLRPGTHFFSDKQWHQVENIRFSNDDYPSPTAGDIPESLTIYLKLESK